MYSYIAFTNADTLVLQKKIVTHGESEPIIELGMSISEVAMLIGQPVKGSKYYFRGCYYMNTVVILELGI